MAFKVADVANIQSPGSLPCKLIVGDVQFFYGGVEGEYDILFEGLCGGVID